MAVASAYGLVFSGRSDRWEVIGPNGNVYTAPAPGERGLRDATLFLEELRIIERAHPSRPAVEEVR